MHRTVLPSSPSKPALAPPPLPPSRELTVLSGLQPSSPSLEPLSLDQLHLELIIPDRPIADRIQLREPGVIPPEVQAELTAAVTRGGPLREAVVECLVELAAGCQDKKQADALAALLLPAALLPTRPGTDPAYDQIAHLLDNLHNRYPDLQLDYPAVFAKFPDISEKRRLVLANVLERGLRLAPIEVRTVILRQLLTLAAPYWCRTAPPAMLDRADLFLQPLFSWGCSWRGVPLAENNGEWSVYCCLALMFRAPAPELITGGVLRCHLDFLIRDARQRDCSLVSDVQTAIMSLLPELETLVARQSESNSDPRPNSVLPLTRLSVAARAWLRGDHQTLPADLPRLLLYSPWRQDVLAAVLQVIEPGVPGPHKAVIDVLLGKVGLALLRSTDPTLKEAALNALPTIIRTSPPDCSESAMAFLLQAGIAPPLMQDSQSNVRSCFSRALAAIVEMRRPEWSQQAKVLLDQMPQE